MPRHTIVSRAMAKPKPRLCPARILVAADEPQVRKLFATKLRAAGYDVSEASSGRQALVTLRKTRFHVLVLDLDMLDFDGFDVLKAIRSKMLYLQVLVVSGFMRGTSLKAAEWLGATATIDKRRAPRMLVPTVHRLLSDPCD